LGVGHPGHKDLVHNFVLSNFSKADAEWVLPVLGAVAKAAPRLIEGDIARFQTDVALELTPPKEESQE
ncbi:MAG: aminoacyl-tRNA hydrolase, partial [Sphingomonadales bacterium]